MNLARTRQYDLLLWELLLQEIRQHCHADSLAYSGRQLHQQDISILLNMIVARLNKLHLDKLLCVIAECFLNDLPVLDLHLFLQLETLLLLLPGFILPHQGNINFLMPMSTTG